MKCLNEIALLGLALSRDVDSLLMERAIWDLEIATWL